VKLLKKLSQAMEQGRAGALRSGSRETVIGPQLDITQIAKILPHRYPFLLVDRVIELSDERAVGIKCVTINDYFFRGHFPGRPVMPGVLIVEAMAQVGGIILLNKSENRGKIAYFMSVDKVKFRRPVVPGDVLVIEADLGKLRSRTGQVQGRALVDGKLVCEGELMFALAE
jgi:beta-hydroxyacyl-ACP dehydratase FabZ